MQNFSERLEAAWRSSSLKKGDIARELGVALSTVSRWFNGTVPDSENLHLLAKLLGVDASFLTGADRIGAKYSSSIERSPTLKEDSQPPDAGGINEDDLIQLAHMLIIRMQNEQNPKLEDLATARRALETLRRMRQAKKHEQN